MSLKTRQFYAYFTNYFISLFQIKSKKNWSSMWPVVFFQIKKRELSKSDNSTKTENFSCEVFFFSLGIYIHRISSPLNK